MAKRKLGTRTPWTKLCCGLAALSFTLVSFTLVSACGTPTEDATQEAVTAAAGLEVRAAQATSTGDMGAVYLTVVNPGPEDDRLLRVETTAARAAETHETVNEDGMLRMVARPEGFAVPAGGSLALQPGGKHIMLVAPQLPTGEAAAIALTLHFEQAGAIEVEVPVTALPGLGHEGHDMGHDGHDMGHDGHEMGNDEMGDDEDAAAPMSGDNHG